MLDLKHVDSKSISVEKVLNKQNNKNKKIE